MGKYEEALERAKQGKPINEVFPELKESEDERIRKQIEQVIIEHDWSATYEVSKDDCLAYLEKQKEQKPTEWKPLPESMEALLLAIEGKWDAIKPTGYMSRRLEDLYDGLVNTFNVDEYYLNSRPKTEYTEKDIEEIKALKGKIDSSIETKPEEWSKEFLRLMGITISQDGNQVCVLLGENLAEGIAGFGDTLADAVEDFKKEWRQFDRFRKATWKPSEEQMVALYKAARESPIIKENGNYLYDLYDDLKKLM